MQNKIPGNLNNNFLISDRTGLKPTPAGHCKGQKPFLTFSGENVNVVPVTNSVFPKGVF